MTVVYTAGMRNLLKYPIDDDEIITHLTMLMNFEIESDKVGDTLATCLELAIKRIKDHPMTSVEIMNSIGFHQP